MKPKRTVKMSLRKPTPPRRAAPMPSRAREAEADYEIEDCEAEAEPNMRFSHALFVVLVLHVIAVAGVFAFNSIKARQMAEDAARPAVKPPEPLAATATPAPKSPPSAAAGRQIHVVAAGDTLSKIASKYRSSVEAITAANGISAASLLRIGQEIVIPPPGNRPLMEAAERKKPTLATVVASARTVEAPRPEAKKSAPPPALSQSAAIAAAHPATPPAVQDSKAKLTQAAPAKSVPPEDGVYVVQKGDNPYSIARRYGVSYKKLLEINGIEDPTRVQIGQKLKLPPAP